MKSTKVLVNTALMYAVAAMAGGVFYREFTKFNMFEGRTALGFVHTHLFLLGMLFFLVAAVLDKQFALTERRGFKEFFMLYNTGLVVMTIGLVWRGVAQVKAMELSIGIDAAISGVSGLGHIFLALGLIGFFVLLKRQLAGVPIKSVDRKKHFINKK